MLIMIGCCFLIHSPFLLIAAHDDDLEIHADDKFWYKRRNVVSGIVNNFETDIPQACTNRPVMSSSGNMFGADFVPFLYEYCDRGCEEDCFIDHACGNGVIDQPLPNLDLGNTGFTDIVAIWSKFIYFLISQRLLPSLVDARAVRLGTQVELPKAQRFLQS